MAAMAKSAPEAMPSAAGFQENASEASVFGHDMMRTPAVATTIASVCPAVTLSPRKARPKIATCTGSVLA